MHDWSSMANDEKSKKTHTCTENLAALKLILQEETEGTQSRSDFDGSCFVDDSTTKCERVSDTVDGHVDTDNSKTCQQRTPKQ